MINNRLNPFVEAADPDEIAAPQPDVDPEAPLPPAQDLWDTLVAVLRVIGYTEEFAKAHPNLPVSEGVRLFLAETKAGAYS
jgi:hypothetical protein